MLSRGTFTWRQLKRFKWSSEIIRFASWKGHLLRLQCRKQITGDKDGSKENNQGPFKMIVSLIIVKAVDELESIKIKLTRQGGSC